MCLVSYFRFLFPLAGIVLEILMISRENGHFMEKFTFLTLGDLNFDLTKDYLYTFCRTRPGYLSLFAACAILCGSGDGGGGGHQPLRQFVFGPDPRQCDG